ncbi:hypothetical protein HDU97_002332 [Phlyctochytrium planicorne]|nr:hypothetical protein HDU97_002332 [Phlyctochytrium planicorne]
MVQMFEKLKVFYQRVKDNKLKRRQSRVPTNVTGLSAKKEYTSIVEDVKTPSPKEAPGAVSPSDTKVPAEDSSNLPAFGAQKRPDPSGKVLAIHAWEPRLPDQLELQFGDKITVLKSFNDGWASGRNETRHKTGIFPLHCVQNPEFNGSIRSIHSAEAEAGDADSAWKQVGGLWVKEQ